MLHKNESRWECGFFFARRPPGAVRAFSFLRKKASLICDFRPYRCNFVAQFTHNLRKKTEKPWPP